MASTHRNARTTVSAANAHAGVTDAQKLFAENLAKKAGYRFVSDAEKDCFGKRKIGGLARADFSRLIAFLQAECAK